MMADYERILPGSADRIIAMAERQSAHRQTIEGNVIDSNTVTERRGQIFGFILGLLGLGGGIALSLSGKLTIGLAMFLTVLVAFVTVFVVGKRTQTQERAKRVEQLGKMLESGQLPPQPPTPDQHKD
jgi:uncharacterized membrane protein